MGQTLTHGIYLPDEGERNCYDGLAANWQLLDGAVGTVAEHTTQIAGKAPLVHTHTKSDITDFPAYGTTAGTICEGNDSRLSNARTPVAHTHTKSDVTDLLNSDFIPSANNSYNLGTSTNKWKTLNGINPGALSFPDGTTDNSDTTFNPDTTTWLKDGTSFTITAQVTGWLHIKIKNVTGNFVWVKRASSGNNQTWGLVGDSNSNSGIADIGLNVPVIKDKIYTLKLKTASFYAAIFLCLGNV